MNFSISPELEELRRRVARFVEDRLLPLEADRANYDDHENIALDVLARERAAAREAGLWCLQMPRALGGGGLGKAGMAVVYEEMNRSIFGPVVFNSAAPDDGNMMVLGALGTEAQRDRWLMPIMSGISSWWRAHPRMTGAGTRPSCSIATIPAGGSTAASRSWGRRNMAGTVNWSLTGWRSRRRTCCWKRGAA